MYNKTREVHRKKHITQIAFFNWHQYPSAWYGPHYPVPAWRDSTKFNAMSSELLLHIIKDLGARIGHVRPRGHILTLGRIQRSISGGHWQLWIFPVSILTLGEFILILGESILILGVFIPALSGPVCSNSYAGHWGRGRDKMAPSSSITGAPHIK